MCIIPGTGGMTAAEEVPPGVYLLRFRAGGVVEVKRIVFWP